MKLELNKAFLIYATKLLLIYFVLDYGTTFFIGITSPGGYYISWLDKYFNYVNGLRNIILYGAKAIMQVLNYDVYMPNVYTLRVKGGSAVHMVYSCLGYGLISFWIAFVLATAEIKRSMKLKWLLLGTSIIVLSNMVRVAILLLAVHKKWAKPVNLEHHTFYNYVVYAIIIGFMLLFLRRVNKEQQAS